MEEKSRAAERAEKRRFWEDHLRSWKASDLTQAKYCREHALNVHNFVYWKKRLLPDRGSLVEVPIRLGMRASFPAAISVVIGGYYRIEIHDGFDPCSLEQVIRIVSGL